MRDAGVIGQHESRDSVRVLNVGRLPGERHLDASRTPGDELRQLAFPDPLKAFVNLTTAARTFFNTLQVNWILNG